MNDAPKDQLGDRMKLYERVGGTEQLMPLCPIVVRLDGKAFHSFTRGLARPYDERLSSLMVETTTFLVELSNARIGYTQSDEITLILYSDDYNSEVYFGGRRDKLVSVLAAYATLRFNQALPTYIPEKASRTPWPVFDCRAFTVPTGTEAANALVWREQDATRNSISMAAQSQFSHKQLHNKSCDEMQEMLFQERGINWNDYPASFKRGTYVQRRTVTRAFTTDELDKLPLKHAARTNPNLVVERREIGAVDMPVLTKVINRESVVLHGQSPAVENLPQPKA